MAAARMVSAPWVANWRPLGWTVIWWVELAVSVMTFWLSLAAVTGRGCCCACLLQCVKTSREKTTFHFAFKPKPLGALPARFRRQRLLIVGCGDVGLRVACPAGRRHEPPRPARAGADQQ
jgi:hypothetical protein